MKELNILYMCDDDFAEMAGVSMTSLLENNKNDLLNLTIYLLGVSLSKENTERFHALEQRYGQKVILINADNEYEKVCQMKLNGYRGSNMTNLRLRFEELLPQSVHRILYIDCDTIVSDSLAELADYPLEGKLLGMVLDAYGKLLSEEKDEAYYNAGVLLIDCDKWRQENWSEKIQTFICENDAVLTHPDQDLLNIVCKETIALLPMKYNFQVVHREYSDTVFCKYLMRNEYYSKQEIEETRKNPTVLHLVRALGTNPWCRDGHIHPDYDIYNHYKKKSVWCSEQKKENKPGGVVLCERILRKTLPEKMFFPLKLWSIKTMLGRRKRRAQATEN